MSKREKRLSAVLAAVFTVCMTGGLLTAYADTSTVTYTVSPSYTVTIPAETVEVAYQEASHPVGEITVEDMHLEPGKCVVIAVENSGQLALTNEKDSHELKYSLVDAKGKTFTSKAFTENGVLDDLSVAVSQGEWKTATSGHYTGTTTFTISYEDVQ